VRVRPEGVITMLLRRRARILVAATALLTASPASPMLASPAAAGHAAAGHAGHGSRVYQNPISAQVADTYADPSVIRGKDGWWYAFATSDPLREGEREPVGIPVSRSADLVHWQYVGPVFAAANRPAWVTPTSGLWAPDIRYLDGRYVLYYTATDTASNPGDDSAIGVATAPTPAGPWTDSGAPAVEPRPAPGGGFLWTFDPAQLTAADGSRWLYYGSYFGGIFAVPLSADGLRAAGPATMVALDNRYEGGYVVRHGGWYYLFASAANCCAGPTTGYSVFAGRSANPTGPFVDREGVPLTTSRVGGTPVIQPNGNIWVGTGHNAVLTDAAGQDWLVYHAIDRRDPYLNEPFGINERPMLLDRLDWIGGWPVVGAGAGASQEAQPAPVTAGPMADTFERPGLGADWRVRSGSWGTAALSADAGRSAVHTGTGAGELAARAHLPEQLRVQADVRVGGGAAGVAVRYRGPADQVAVRVDEAAGALVMDVVTRGRHSATAVPLPAGFRYGTWHTLAVEVRGGRLSATVTEAGLNDPVATATRLLPPGADGTLALVARGPAAIDNVTAAAAARPVTRPAPVPRVGRLDPAYSDEFTAALGPGWTWVRPDPDAVVAGGALRWPTQAADLVGTANDASVLLREPPAGDYVVETRLTIDLGVDTVRNYQQAGLVAYAGDDDFARLSHVAIWNTRQVEFGRELPFAGGLSYGGMVLGPPAETTWLRLAHTVDRRTGEHRFRAASSRDGAHWVWGGSWTFPPSTPNPRIGLLAQGGDTPQATAIFDYLRVYR
jgi:arabinan endo-1,5-alpha-L-arabinosidase